MNSSDEKFYNDCFTETEEGKVNAEFNKATLKCFDSKDNKFSMDCEGNLVVNSIITREENNTSFSIDSVYPIGSIYMNVSATDPGTLFGGTWEQIKGRFLLGCGNNGDGVNYEVSSIGGEATHTLNVNEIPNHNHSINLTTTDNGIHTHNLRRDLGGNEFGIGGGTGVGNSLNGTWSNTSIWPNSIGAGPAGNHYHFVSGNTGETGGNLAHNNMPPYLAVYIWKRVA